MGNQGFTTVRISIETRDKMLREKAYYQTMDDYLRELLKLDPTEDGKKRYDDFLHGSSARERKPRRTKYGFEDIEAGESRVYDMERGSREAFKLCRSANIYGKKNNVAFEFSTGISDMRIVVTRIY